MALSKEKKQQQVVQLKELVTRSKAVIITDYRGLAAGQMAELRNRLRPLNSQFMVAKNTMVSRSLQELGLPSADQFLKGPCGLGFCFADVGAPTRAMAEFGKETKLLKLKGGLLEDRVIDANQVNTLAQLPTHDVLLAQTLASIQSPVSHFVGLLDGALRGVLGVFDARAEQLGEASVA